MNTLFLLSDAISNEEIRLKKDDSEEEIVGGIILNRIVGIAFDKLNPNDFNKESIRILGETKKYYESRYVDFLDKLEYLSIIMKEAEYRYAFLKGAILIPCLYTQGQRISNDIDILIEPADATKANKHLTENGFVQGYSDDSGKIIPATRKEIIDSKMNYGETVSYLRYYHGRIIEVDLNFSTDFKAKGCANVVHELLNDCERISINNEFIIKTLSKEDFLIHLCCHLYKEATTYDWVVNRRDLMLYKFSDINVFLSQYASSGFMSKLKKRILQLGVERECFYTFTNSALIYDRINEIPGFNDLIRNIKPDSLDFMTQIIAPKENKMYKYDLSFEDWFLSVNRLYELEEVT